MNKEGEDTESTLKTFLPTRYTHTPTQSLASPKSWLYTCIYMHISIHLHTHMHIHIHRHMYIHMHIHILNIYVHSYIHACNYVHTPTHSYACALTSVVRCGDQLDNMWTDAQICAWHRCTFVSLVCLPKPQNFVRREIGMVTIDIINPKPQELSYTWSCGNMKNWLCKYLYYVLIILCIFTLFGLVRRSTPPHARSSMHHFVNIQSFVLARMYRFCTRTHGHLRNSS